MCRLASMWLFEFSNKLSGGLHRIFLPFIGGYSRSFSRSGAYIAERGFAFYAIDLPGNGQSGINGDCGTVTDQLKILERFLSNIKAYHPGLPVYVMGCSLGSGHVAGFASRYPVAADGIILLAPPVELKIKNYQEMIPALIAHGNADTINYYDGRFELFERMKGADKEFVTLHGAGHGFYGLFVFDEAYLNDKAFDFLDTVVEYLDMHLSPI